MSDYGTTHHFGPHVYAKQMHLSAGEQVLTHKHRFDHMSILARGHAYVEIDGEGRMHYAPDVVNIRAGAAHTITAMTDIDWFCIHATDEIDTDKIDATLIQEN